MSLFCDILVECSYGRYYKDGQCVKCDFGTYQDEIGQPSCKECPEGTTTPGRDSRSIIECSVNLNEKSDGIYNVYNLIHTLFIYMTFYIQIYIFNPMKTFYRIIVYSRGSSIGPPVYRSSVDYNSCFQKPLVSFGSICTFSIESH